jgi:Domain of unknown function (DUF3067)
MTGQNLRQWICQKWGYSYDLQLRRVQGKVILQVMWRYLEQASFPLSETEYLEHLNAIALRLGDWQALEQVRLFIEHTKERPRLGKAVNIPIELSQRASEWFVEEL